MKGNNLERIQNVSGKFKILFTALIFIIPATNLIFWLSFNYLPVGFTIQLPVPTSQPLSIDIRLLAFLASSISDILIIYGLFHFKKLFSLYEQGIVFTQKNVQCFHRIGLSVIGFFVACLIQTPLLGLALTMHNPPGERMLTLQIGSQNISTLIMGATILLISWVMNEAAKLEHEQTHTV